MLIYAGDVDFICNWMGNKAWTQELPWSGKTAFEAEPDTTWSYDNIAGGMARTAAAAKGEGSLTFLQVYEAGHMVPLDQPEASLEFFNRWLAKEWF